MVTCINFQSAGNVLRNFKNAGVSAIIAVDFPYFLKMKKKVSYFVMIHPKNQHVISLEFPAFDKSHCKVTLSAQLRVRKRT